MNLMLKILELMVRENASDVYLAADTAPLIRINGHCERINEQEIARSQVLNLLSEILTSRQIEELKELGELNITVTLPKLGHFRFSAMRQKGNYSAVVRYISLTIPPFDTLFLPTSLTKFVMDRLGLVLLVGPSGSGKSTTIASLLDYRNERMSGHILTVEDPIEYVFTSKRSIVNQREVGIDTATLQTALRNGLRQAPDVFFIGEIRDRETMSAAIAYAQTGHLCFATLHANNSYHALNRILSFYPAETRHTLLSDISTSLNAVISQRLVKTIQNKRLPAVEVLQNTLNIQEMILKGDFYAVKHAMENSMAAGSQSFEDDLYRMITEGFITREEGLSHADSPINLIWRLDNSSLKNDPRNRVDSSLNYEPAFFQDIGIV